MKTINNTPPQNRKVYRTKPTFSQALLGLAMSSIFVVTNAADNNSFTIRIVEKDAVLSQPAPVATTASVAETAFEETSIAMPVAAATTTLTKTQIQSQGSRTVRLDDGGVIWVTSDPVKLTPMLDVTTNKDVRLSGNRFAAPITFTLNTNYAAFIDSWELNVYQASDVDERKPLKSFKGSRFLNGHIVDWDGEITSGYALAAGDELKYILTVRNKAGHSDVTHARQLVLQNPRRNIREVTNTPAKAQNNLARQTIPLHGARVRIFGNDIVNGNSITIDGESTAVVNRRFVVERILPHGKHFFDVNVTERNNKSYSKKLTTDVNGRYMFMVGIADLTAGKGNIKGNLETLSDGDKYLGGDIFVDGRVAFYMKGKVRGRYLITAQMDTGTADIDELFDNIHKKDPKSVFSRLDPDKYYPVYGDDSTIVDDTNSQGKMYVRVDWDKSRAIWGNYNTDMTGTELSSFNRSLYGAKYSRKSLAVTAAGDHKSDWTLFASESQSAYRHNEFLGTGGSLYYFKDTDIVIGSEKVWVEVRDKDSGRVSEKIVMEEGRDYQMDDFQGRLILNRPLLQIAEQTNPSLIKDNPLTGDQLYLMVDYEYVPDNFDSDKASYGARGKVWLGNHVALGASYAHENRDEDAYDLKGVDVTLKKSKGTFVVAEYAETESLQTAGSFTSDDGGLHFDDLITDKTLAKQSGAAYSVEARVNLQDFANKKGEAAAWYKNREAGFSNTSSEQGIAAILAGLEASINATKNLRLSTRVTQLDKKGVSKVSQASLQGDYSRSRVTVGAEVKVIKEEDQRGAATSSDGEGMLAAFKVGYGFNENVNLYVIAQHTIEKSGAYESNDLLTIGTKSRISKRLGINAELSSGDRGEAATAGLDYKWNDKHSFYTNYTLSTDSTFDKRNVFTIGQRRAVSNRLNVFTEHQFTHEADQSGLGHTFGMDYDFNKDVTLSGSVQTAELDRADGGVTERDALTAGVTFKRGKSSGSSRIEYRRDNVVSGTDPKSTEQWVTTNAIHYRATPSLRYQGKLNHSVTRDEGDQSKDATFTEAEVGFAYRPVTNDRLNVLGRVGYLHDLQPESQSSDPDAQSLLASLEATLQMSQRWQVGGKLAHKQSEIRTDRDLGTWFENDASLASARVKYHMNHHWDATAAYHWMNSDASQDTQHGAMVSIDRHLGSKMKVGIGYNFTNFTDDLKDTESDVEGWFVNLVGKF